MLVGVGGGEGGISGDGGDEGDGGDGDDGGDGNDGGDGDDGCCSVMINEAMGGEGIDGLSWR